MKFEQGNIIWGIVGIALGGILAIIGLTLTKRVSPASIVIVPPDPTPTVEPSPTPGPIQVFVNGHVAHPAVYTLPRGCRVEEAINAAGGFLADADTAVVNLALPLTDGAQVYVPGLAEEVPPPLVTNPTPASDTAGGTGSQGELVNINSATLEDLDALPGIGPSTAQKILDYRDENGRFAVIEDIMNVSGIGDAKFNQIKSFITVVDENP